MRTIEFFFCIGSHVSISRNATSNFRTINMTKMEPNKVIVILLLLSKVNFTVWQRSDVPFHEANTSFCFS